MGILDFLFEGAPPPSVTEYGVTTENLPAWYSDYTQGLIAKANAIAAEPYQTYGQPRLAELDPYQTAAYQQTFDLGSQISPLYGTARGYIEGAAAPGASAAASPYFTQSGALATQFSGADTSALAQPYLTSAEQLAQRAAGETAGIASPYLSSAQQLAQQATGATAGIASPYLTGAEELTRAGAAGTSALAQPYLSQAGQMIGQAGAPITGQIADYMDPYRQQVVDRIGELGKRQFTENVLPALQAQGISSGQFGGTRSAEAIGRALRDTQESTLAAQQAALSQGYGQAAQLASSDAARALQAAQAQAGLGTTAAGLSAADLQRQIAAGQQLGTLGTTAAGLTSADLQRQLAASQQMGALGTTAAGLSSADLQRALAASQQVGALGTTAAGLESTDVARQLAAAQQLGTVGQQLGALTQQDLARQLQAGAQYGALAGDEQTAALQRIGALEAAGAAQQQDVQRNLDLAYQDFLQQQEYDRQNIAFLNAAVRGLEVPTQITKESTGPASVYQPSPLSQLAAGFGAYSGLRKVLG